MENALTQELREQLGELKEFSHRITGTVEEILDFLEDFRPLFSAEVIDLLDALKYESERVNSLVKRPEPHADDFQDEDFQDMENLTEEELEFLLIMEECDE